MSSGDLERRRQRLEDEYDPMTVEPHWQDRWVTEGTYRYQGGPEINPDTVYAIDTPPPTVSGDLHMGHLYGHTLQDFAARFHRMAGEYTFFPFGYDDNGIASERLTEDELGIHHGDFTRREFKQKCRDVCREYEADFTREMQALATSIDWDRTYKTIEQRVQRISQLSFLDLYEQDREYRQKAPAIWCPDCQTAISQVEMEGEKRDSYEHDIAFELVSLGTSAATPVDDSGDGSQLGDDLIITTTRPELLPACVAMFVHPEDEENSHLVGGTARVPLFGHEVPILADDRVDRETGTGLVMSCTFGDGTDIEWYQAYDLDLRVAIDESGTMTDAAGDYAGLSTETAREAIAEDLQAADVLLDRRPITHTVQVHERSCDAAVEYLVTEQWYIRLLDKKDEYLAAGREMDWYPEKMFSRYKHWIEGLEWDWCISRQRDSGIPFPVWYCAHCDETILADRSQLPVDPLADAPPVAACPSCGGDNFEPEDDVFDTWATSSLTPLINAGWEWDAEASPDDPTVVSETTARSRDAEKNGSAGAFTFANPELYPFDLRPQGHDIISFWLFHTVVKCLEHTGTVPFDGVLINGHVLDENREKMSSSRGNVVPPAEVMEEYPVDAIRYWAASSAVGDDFPFKENELRQGEKLIQKLWNASKLTAELGASESASPAELRAIDQWLLASLDEEITRLTEHFEAHEYAKARNRLREFFWHTFCDDYLEIAKQRNENGIDASGAYTLATALETFLQLFAPLMPHVTEEIWTTLFGPERSIESIHRTDWPEPSGYETDIDAGSTALAVIAALRRYKTDRGMALNADLERVDVYAEIGEFGDAIESVMHIDDLRIREDAPKIDSEISDIDLDYSLIGPKLGNRVSDVESAIDAGEFTIDNGRLLAAGETLEPATFELRKEQVYTGDGELVTVDRPGVSLVVH